VPYWDGKDRFRDFLKAAETGCAPRRHALGSAAIWRR